MSEFDADAYEERSVAYLEAKVARLTKEIARNRTEIANLRAARNELREKLFGRTLAEANARRHGGGQ
ncbi:hypothetical protein [Nocardia cyriacigeorgica]|uniref:hypothetical protein n=1 Tax=Nocardia cyriacigeorgica TaxID=135487 RepID=UPI002454A1B7|nr:hypothetical protein [Nocardia cyriacigeorgica]